MLTVRHLSLTQGTEAFKVTQKEMKKANNLFRILSGFGGQICRQI